LAAVTEVPAARRATQDARRRGKRIACNERQIWRCFDESVKGSLRETQIAKEFPGHPIMLPSMRVEGMWVDFEYFVSSKGVKNLPGQDATYV